MPPDSVPLSFNQAGQILREWWDSLSGGPQAPCQVVLSLCFEGALDTVRLEAALTALVQRHEVLRTAFPDPRQWSSAEQKTLIERLARAPIADVILQDERLTGRLEPTVAIRLATRDCAECGTADLTEHVMPLVVEEMNTPLRYDAPPLMRATLLRLGARRHVLILTLHHLVGDGWTLGVVRAELEKLYDQCVITGTPSLPPASGQYSEFAQAQRQGYRASEPDAATAYWRDRWIRLSDALVRPTQLPGARPATRGPIWCSVERLTIEPALAHALRARCRLARVTPYMLWLTAVMIVLHGYTRRRTVAIYGHVANRLGSKTENLIGWVETGVILGVDVQPQDSVADVLARARDMVRGGADHQNVPLPVIWKATQAALGRRAELGLHEHVAFDMGWRDQTLPSQLADGVRVDELPTTLYPQPGTSSFEIRINETGSAPTVAARHDAARFEPGTVRQVLDHIVGVVRLVAESGPTATVDAALATIGGTRAPPSAVR